MKLINITQIKATLVLKTGLHIGAGDSEMHIGGIDASVIKNPITKLPYIPGSSLKGKIRSLLEWRSGYVQKSPLSIKDIPNNNDKDRVMDILRLFGTSSDAKQDQEKMVEIGIPRLAFWDCELDAQWEIMTKENHPLITEVKSENTIDRIKSTAEHPRFIERVPAGARFEFNLTLKEFEGDSEELLKLVLKGLRLLELDSLGGSGSRGYGKIEFQNITLNNIPYDDLDRINPFE